MITKNTPLKEILKLAAPCSCNSCRSGCRHGSGSLAEGDIKNISKFLKITEEELKSRFLEEKELFNKRILKPRLVKNENKPYGQCVFYDEKEGCRIHDVKPLECKTSIQCKDYGEDLSAWFMVNFIVDKEDPESIRQYSQYIKTGGKMIPGAELEKLVPDKERLRKILSYEILK